MDITTNFSVGDEFWMPRVRYQYIKDTKLFGGLEYERIVPILVAYVKQKRIFRIEINIQDTIEVEYWCEDVIEEGKKAELENYNMSRICQEKDFKYKTKDEALEFAQNWLTIEHKEYFGESL